MMPIGWQRESMSSTLIASESSFWNTVFSFPFRGRSALTLIVPVLPASSTGARASLRLRGRSPLAKARVTR